MPGKGLDEFEGDPIETDKMAATLHQNDGVSSSMNRHTSWLYFDVLKIRRCFTVSVSYV